MKLPFKGLSYHTSSPSTCIFLQCSRIPHHVSPIPVQSILNSMPKSHNNTLLMVSIRLLEIAYEDPSQQILRRLKQVAYDEDVLLSAFGEEK